jgi:hypothetical protein
MTIDPNDQFIKYQLPDRKHRSQSLWQIWVPLIVVLLLIAGVFMAMLIVTGSGSMDLGLAQNAAIILLILPIVLVGLLSFIALGLVIAGTSRLIQIVPRLRLLSMHLDSIAAAITTWSNRLMLPFVISARVREKLASKKEKGSQAKSA